ncbi:MAG TPA: sulfotransferase domain-containing protein [Spirochaetota bacterium]|nr:sulfotransferase domain-containing protein [Spirochaetota bacterium]
MESRKICIVSPREPSGATWLINCFLELGVKTYRNSQFPMWMYANSSYTLSPHENLLKKWLPALTTYERFNFRDDVEVQWTHEWPSEKFLGKRIIYFIRDPRDSIYSRYKRENPDLSFREFIDFPDIWTLLNKIDHWILFNRLWMKHEDLKIFRFEDYKSNDVELLKNILANCDLDYSMEKIRSAAAASTFEKAVEAERKYMEENPEDGELINRSGKPGSWKGLKDDGDVIKRIEKSCANLLKFFNYETTETDREDNVKKLYPSVQILPFFKDKLYTDEFKHCNKRDDYNNFVRDMVSFGFNLNKDLINRARLQEWESYYLVNSLYEVINRVPADFNEVISLLNINGILNQPSRSNDLMSRIKRSGLLNTFMREIRRYYEK